MTYTDIITNNPQTEPIIGRADMVQNNAGGYGFKVDDQELLNRFLLLGTESNSYYCGKETLTKEFAKEIIRMIQEDSETVYNLTYDSIINNKAMKPDAGIFVMSLLATFGTPVVKNLVYGSIYLFCRTATHLFLFVDSVNKLRGWSRGLRNGVAKWYTAKSVDELAYQIVKYRNRHGFTHKDVLRLSHPKIKNDEYKLYQYAVGKCSTLDGGMNPNYTPVLLVNTFEKLQAANTVEEVLTLLKIAIEADLPITWEMVPNEFLNNTKVLEFLLERMPTTALLRNLNRFSYNGMTVGRNEIVDKICFKLSQVRNIHPMSIVNTLVTYKSGKGVKGGKTWDVNNQIVDALVDAYEISLNDMVKSEFNCLVAVDVSGSMSSYVGGLQIEAYKLANTLAYTILKTNPNSEVIWFDDEIRPCGIRRTSSLTEVLDIVANGGGTDCSLAFDYALNNLKNFDAIIILTDSETWAGTEHGAEVLNKYKHRVNADVKVVEVAMVSNPHSTLPSDKNLLRVVGFDANVPELIQKFIGE